MKLQLSFTIGGQTPQVVVVEDPPLIIGTLLSNQVVLRAADVDPIHALIEENESGDGYVVTDVGSESGVYVNDKKVDVETPIKPGDSIRIGSVKLLVSEYTEEAKIPVPPIPPHVSVPTVPRKSSKSGNDDVTKAVSATSEVSHHSSHDAGATVKKDARDTAEEKRVEKRDLLFSPRKARPSGDVLEVVAYWSDTIVDVELFHETFKGYEKATIGDPSKTNFVAAGPVDIDHHVLATVQGSGYEVNLTEGMEARMRRAGKVESVKGPGRYKMGRRDIVHIKFGAIRYFLLFVRPPVINLPRSGPRDPVFAMLSFAAALFYLALIPMLWIGEPKDPKKDKDDIWMLVQTPRKEEKPKPQVKPKPIQNIAKVKQTPPKNTPPKVKKPIKAATPKEVEKPKQTKVVEKPKEVPKKAAEANLQRQKVAPTPTKAQTAKSSNGNGGAAGTASASATKPDFKKAGPRNNNTASRSGGARGGGMNQQGGARKGNDGASHKGVEGPKNKKASGVNLSKLGLGVGKILNKSGPGAINTKFKSSAGGAGGGAGHGNKTYGLGGMGSSKSLGLSGAGGAVNNFGSGSGGFGSGDGGNGGLGGAGIGKGFGSGSGDRGRANVTVPSSGPVVSGGLTRQEILAVIRSNLNQIRHCYEQLLQRSPRSSGKLVVDFTIGSGGRVAAISAGGGISDSIMRGCVTGRIKRWKFPEPRGASSVNVKYPFVFTPL